MSSAIFNKHKIPRLHHGLFMAHCDDYASFSHQIYNLYGYRQVVHHYVHSTGWFLIPKNLSNFWKFTILPDYICDAIFPLLHKNCNAGISHYVQWIRNCYPRYNYFHNVITVNMCTFAENSALSQFSRAPLGAYPMYVHAWHNWVWHGRGPWKLWLSNGGSQSSSLEWAEVSASVHIFTVYVIAKLWKLLIIEWQDISNLLHIYSTTALIWTSWDTGSISGWLGFRIT